MKVIDLLNKIANGEEVPDKIKHGEYIYKTRLDGYYKLVTEDNIYCLDVVQCLNDEIEIIEENNKIEPLTRWFDEDGVEDARYNTEKRIVDKINEIIDEINKLKEEK